MVDGYRITNGNHGTGTERGFGVVRQSDGNDGQPACSPRQRSERFARRRSSVAAGCPDRGLSRPEILPPSRHRRAAACIRQTSRRSQQRGRPDQVWHPWRCRPESPRPPSTTASAGAMSNSAAFPTKRGHRGNIEISSIPSTRPLPWLATTLTGPVFANNSAPSMVTRRKNVWISRNGQTANCLARHGRRVMAAGRATREVPQLSNGYVARDDHSSGG